MAPGTSRYSAARIRRAVLYFLFGRGLQAATFLVLTLVLVRVLSARDYGAYMALWGLVEVMVPLGSLGLLETSRRYVPMLVHAGSRRAVRRFVHGVVAARLGLLLLWAVVLTLGWAALVGFLGLDEGASFDPLPAVAVIVSVPVFRFLAELLESLLEQQWSQCLHVVMQSARLLNVAVLVATDALSLSGVLLGDACVAAGCLVAALAVVHRKIGELPDGPAPDVALREVLAFSWHLAGVNLLQSTASIGTLRLLVARFLGLEAAGMFAFIQQLLLMMGRYMPGQVFAGIVRPVLAARHAQGEHQVVVSVLELLWKANLIVLLAWLATAGVSGDALLARASGGRFPDAALVLALLILGLGATLQGQTVSMGMQIYGLTRQLRAQSLLFLLVPVGVYLGSFFGLPGVAAGIAITHGLKNSFAIWWLRRNGVRLAYDLQGVGRILAAMALSMLLAAGVHALAGPWVALAALAVTGTCALVCCKPLREKDFVVMSGLVKGRMAQWLRGLVWTGRNQVY